MGGCLHRSRKTSSAPAAMSFVTRDFLSQVRPLDLIVFRDTLDGPIERVELAITMAWHQGSRFEEPPLSPQRPGYTRAVLERPITRVRVGTIDQTWASPRQELRLDTRYELENEIKRGSVWSPRLHGDDYVSDDESSMESDEPLFIRPLPILSSTSSTQLLLAPRRHFSDTYESTAETEINFPRLATGGAGKGRLRKTTSLPARVEMPDTQKLYAWGEAPTSLGSARIMRMRSLADLAQSYVDHPTANIGVCRLINNPTCAEHHEPSYRTEIRRNRLRAQVAEAYELFVGGMCSSNTVGFAAAMFPSLRGLVYASDVDLERFMRNNAWLPRSEFAALVYTRLGFAGGSFDLTESSADAGPVDFSGEYLVGHVPSICDLPPFWAKRPPTGPPALNPYL